MRATGLAVFTGPDGVVRHDTLGCGHCGAVHTVNVMTTLGGYCGQCHVPVCEKCGKDGRCLPLLARIEASEEQAYRLRQAGI